MPYLPQIEGSAQSRDVTDTFYGYNHKLKIRPGEMYHTENLTTTEYPMLASRKRRGFVTKLSKPQGILAKDKLVYVNNGHLFYGDEEVMAPQSPADPRISGNGEKQLINFGSYIIILPDKLYYNTKDPTDKGKIEANVALSGLATYTRCTVTGEGIDAVDSASAPVSPANGAYWYDTAHNLLKCWSESQNEWVTVETVYTKITFPDDTHHLNTIFKEHDGVSLMLDVTPNNNDDPDNIKSALDGDKVLYGVGDKYIIVVGLIKKAYGSDNKVLSYVTVSRAMPKMDYVFECQNRLWGCYYGLGPDGKHLNEIYCSALGDFKNWRQYMGVSTDSWTASIGSDGPWTGAINYLGNPTFVKENVIHRVSVSAYGAHRIDETPCRGAQLGCHKSLAIVDELLLYKGRNNVCGFQGGFPEDLGTALGDEQYTDAVAGVFNSQYYISMKDAAGDWHLFVYNCKNHLWIREDNFHALGFAAVNGSFYALNSDGEIWDLTGIDGTQEKNLRWIAQTGVLYYELPNKKYTARYDIMLTATKGSLISVFIQYDSDGIWRYHGRIPFYGLNSITFPVRPRRCNHMELRIEGQGDAKIYSIARILEQGSDM